MIRSMRVCAGLGTALCAAMAGTLSMAQPVAGTATPPPIEAFFGPEQLHSAVLSPSGRWLATVVQPANARARLVVSDLEAKEPAKVVAMFAKLDVGRVTWVNDEWLVFTTIDQVDRGNARRGAGLMTVRRDGERIRLLIKREWDTEFPAGGGQPLEANHRMLDVGAAGTNEIIVGEVKFDTANEVSHVTPFAIDVTNSARRNLAANAPADVVDWVFDAKGRARAALALKDDKIVLSWFDLATEKWRTIGAFPRLDLGFAPRFIDDADQLFVQHDDEDGYAALSRFDLSAGKPVSPSWVSTPGYDGAIGVIQDRRTGVPQALGILTDRRSQVWLSPEMRAIQAKVNAVLPGRVNRLSCGPCEKPRTVLVFSSSDRSPGEYLLYRPDSDRWERWGSVRPAIDPDRMATMEMHRVKARDGVEFPVWITRKAPADGKPQPVIVLVHGGPWTRGSYWRWDNEAQFLASRGYVVVEPEFRGSTGYGEKLYRAGWKQWGQAMQDDVSDALRFAVQRGWADEKRACIAGASYGGYATLMGLAKDPSQYRCGVAWVAVSDPRLMYSLFWSDIDSGNKQFSMPQMIGDPVKDAAMLAANSPLEQAARIKAPVFLAYGGRDQRVPIEHGERMRDALARHGNPPEWQVYDVERHGFVRPENQFDFWQRVEAFLAKHLK